MSEEGLSYQTSGVAIGEANRAVRSFADAVRSTYNANVLSDVGAFGGLFSGHFPDFADPVLVSSIDGVGTKTKVAAMAGSFFGLGKDIVNHCVNDILVQGAKPLFFLDYFATAKLTAEMVREVVEGAAEACKENGCALLGGETAEMPGVYSDGECDVVGCIVGVVDKTKLLPTNVENGDLIVGIASNGLHTNGFSLARAALFSTAKRKIDEPFFESTIGETLLKPHRSYYSPLWPLLQEGGWIKAMAHLTGGGFIENIPRILGPDVRAVVEKHTWQVPPIFQLIQTDGNIADEEMYRVFNMGVGMVLITPSERAPQLVERLNSSGETAWVIGEITKGARGAVVV